MNLKVVCIRDSYFLNRNRRVLSRLRLSNTGDWRDARSVFTVKPLHLLHLVISKKQMECIAAYLTLTEKLINVLTPRRQMWRTHVLETHFYMSISLSFRSVRERRPGSRCKSRFYNMSEIGVIKRTFCNNWTKRNDGRGRLFKRRHVPSFCSSISEQGIVKFSKSGPYKTSHTERRQFQPSHVKVHWI